MDEQYHADQAEAEVQKYWEDEQVFQVSENSEKEKFYCLSMFPYPSGELHIGHIRNYTLGDVIGRFRRLQGRNVLQPMGWDAFGLPAENAAMKHNVAPAEWTRDNIERMKHQMKSLGLAFDWSRELATNDPDYYRWEQWFFLRLLKKGLVYRKKAWVNWDPVDQTVLANEQVVDGMGWRSGVPVERRELDQWFLKITAYAEELLEFLDKLPGWPDKVKIMQRNWIGKSHGVEMSFPLPDSDDAIAVYTTRPDTLMGATYLAIAPQHDLAKRAAVGNPELSDFLEACTRVKMAEADMATMEKLGMDTGMVAEHPLTGELLPVWVANFVLMEYGEGAVMSVPGHDQRDWEFAHKYGLQIVQVIEPAGADGECDIGKAAFVEKGVLVNSDRFDGLTSAAAFDAIAEELQERGRGSKTTNYRLRDWGVSRQRYWGCPIPMIHCPNCGVVPVPEEDLPVILPTNVTLTEAGSPLRAIDDWYKVPCPECKGEAVRETDTFDTFVESSWYYARFACSSLDTGMLDERAEYWTSVDHYIGGEEHSILHLLYARFFHKAMRDEGLLDTDEPFENLLALGMVLKDGVKMSKSSGDAGNPQHLVDAHGADAVRMAMMFAAPPEQSFEWSERGVEAAGKHLRRIWKLVGEHLSVGATVAVAPASLNDPQKELRRKTHETIARATDDYGRRLAFNTVVSAVMELINEINRFEDDSEQGRAVVHEALRVVVIAMSPITPHICHQLWQALTGEALEDARWPELDESALEKKHVEIVVQVNGKLRGKLEVDVGKTQEQVEELARAIDNVSRFMEDKTVRKVIYVPEKLLNFVVT